MPRFVRNFWLEGKIDGRVGKIDGGPKAKDGGFTLRIYQRDRGQVTLAGRLQGRVSYDGELILEFLDTDNNTKFQHKTQQ